MVNIVHIPLTNFFFSLPISYFSSTAQIVITDTVFAIFIGVCFYFAEKAGLFIPIFVMSGSSFVLFVCNCTLFELAYRFFPDFIRAIEEESHLWTSEVSPPPPDKYTEDEQVSIPAPSDKSPGTSSLGYFYILSQSC